MKLSIAKSIPQAALLSLAVLASLSSLPALALDGTQPALSGSTLSYDDGDWPPVCYRKPSLPQCNP